MKDLSLTVTFLGAISAFMERVLLQGMLFILVFLRGMFFKCRPSMIINALINITTLAITEEEDLQVVDILKCSLLSAGCVSD